MHLGKKFLDAIFSAILYIVLLKLEKLGSLKYFPFIFTCFLDHVGGGGVLQLCLNIGTPAKTLFGNVHEATGNEKYSRIQGDHAASLIRQGIFCPV